MGFMNMEQAKAYVEDLREKESRGSYITALTYAIEAMSCEKSNKTELMDGITQCCGYDFGIEGFGKVKVKYCPMCGKEIISIN